MKYFFDLKYISELKFMRWYGLIGAIICFIGGIITTFIPCVNNNIFEGINYICKINSNNSLFFDHFLIFFKSIWSFNIFILIIKILLKFLLDLLMVKIIKIFNPEYFICANYFYYFIKYSFQMIYDAFNPNQFHYILIFKYIVQIFAILGNLIYLELVQLNFCNLNYYLKKNINKRGKDDENVEDLYEDDDSNDS